jgi:sporulation integral membrane protein YtvI
VKGEILLNLHFIYSLIRFLFVIIVLIVTSVLLVYISKVTYPFIIAFIIAFLINPAVNYLVEKGKLPRGLAVTIALVLILAILAGIFTLLINEMVSGFAHLAHVVPTHLQTLINHIQSFFAMQILPLYYQLADLFQRLDPDQQDAVLDNIESVGSNLTSLVRDMAENIVDAITRFVVSLPNFLTVFMFSLLATFFISKDWYKIARKLRSWTSVKIAESTKSVYLELRKALFGFIKAQLTLISITAVIVLIGLLILRVNYAITIAIIIGAVDLLPYLGTGAVFVPWIIYSFFTENFTLTIGLSILYAIVVVQRQLMEPKVLSSNIGLDPLATLIALFVGFKLFGVLGLIIGPVSLVVIRALSHANVFKELWAFIIGKKST